MATTAIPARAATPDARSLRLQRDRAERLFYLLAGLCVMAFVAAGFHEFYLRGRAPDGGPVTQQIAALVVVHGVLMSSWVVLFILQAGLVVGRRVKLHMRLGVGAAVLAAAIVPVGLAVGVGSIHYRAAGADAPWGPLRYLLPILTQVICFATLVGIGLVNRRRPAVHRPMMLMATLAVTTAGIDRIQALHALFAAAAPTSLLVYFWGPILFAAALLGLLKLAMTRTWDRYFALAYGLLVAFAVASVWIAETGWWLDLARIVQS